MKPIFQRTFDDGVYYIDKSFTLSPSRIAELNEILQPDEPINGFTGDDKYYVVLAWPDLFERSMVQMAVTAAIHHLPVPLAFWDTKTGKQIANMFHDEIENMREIPKGADNG